MTCFHLSEFEKDGKIDKKLADEARENTKKQDDSEVGQFKVLFFPVPSPGPKAILIQSFCHHNALFFVSQIFGRALMRLLGIIWTKTREAIESGTVTPEKD